VTPEGARSGSVRPRALVPERFVSSSEEETREAGRRLAARLVRGDVVAFFGEPGTGKTRFIQGICAALGVEGPVSSPTFTILHEYGSRGLPVYHFDFYRIGTTAEALQTGVADYLREESGVCLIEWADVVAQILPWRRYEVHLAHGGPAGERLIELLSPNDA
jgi:tRNA threonylcarbamoyladenosine biosynthesis protein TsaE